MKNLKLFKEKDVDVGLNSTALIEIKEDSGIQMVSARDLHEKLESAERFSKWWDRFVSYGFMENVDFKRGCTKRFAPSNQYGGVQEVKVDDYFITIEMAKQICMLQRPKAEFYDDVAESKDVIDMSEVAKVLNVSGLGRNKLFELLRGKGILRENNQPYQKYVDAGYFRIIESRFNVPSGDVKISLKTVVFQKGLDYIRKIISKGVEN